MGKEKQIIDIHKQTDIQTIKNAKQVSKEELTFQIFIASYTQSKNWIRMNVQKLLE